MLCTWAQVDDSPAFTEKGFMVMKKGFTEYHSPLFWLVGESMMSHPAHYQGVKRWFSFRWEFFGMASLTSLMTLSEYTEIMHYLFATATEQTFAIHLKMAITFLVYAVENLPDSTWARLLQISQRTGLPPEMYKRDSLW